MADMKAAKERPLEQLWEQLEDIHAGMLGVTGSGQHMQPMAHQIDREARTLWFLTKRDTDLFEAASKPGATAHFTIIGEDHDYYACMCGDIRHTHDRAKLDEIWNPVVAAWYDEGKEDPQLAMLQLSLKDAAIWASTDSTTRFAWEIAKAHMTDQQPDLGARNHINF